MKFIETSVFTKQVKSLLNDDEYRLLQNQILLNPEIGKVIPHSGGLRKMRFAQKKKGKRGGIRVIYYWISLRNNVLMLLLYSKTDIEDLKPKQLKLLKAVVEKELK